MFFLFRPSVWLLILWIIVWNNYVECGTVFGKYEKEILMRQHRNATSEATTAKWSDLEQLTLNNSSTLGSSLEVLILAVITWIFTY